MYTSVKGFNRISFSTYILSVSSPNQHIGRAWFGWSLKPHQHFWPCPIPTSKKNQHRKTYYLSTLGRTLLHVHTDRGRSSTCVKHEIHPRQAQSQEKLKVLVGKLTKDSCDLDPLIEHAHSTTSNHQQSWCNSVITIYSQLGKQHSRSLDSDWIRGWRVEEGLETAVLRHVSLSSHIVYL